MLYILLFERNSTIAFLEAHLLPILVVATLPAILSGWAQARAKLPKAGIFLKSVGRGLIIFVAGAAFFLKLPEDVLVTCLAPGVIFIRYRNNSVFGRYTADLTQLTKYRIRNGLQRIVCAVIIYATQTKRAPSLRSG